MLRRMGMSRGMGMPRGWVCLGDGYVQGDGYVPGDGYVQGWALTSPQHGTSGTIHTDGYGIQRDTVAKQAAVCILLECFLVFYSLVL